MPRLTLTFDNGPTPGITDLVLETLDRFSIKSTFFLVGQQLEERAAREIAESARKAGHRIGNHSYHHGDPLGTLASQGLARREILSTAALIGDLADQNPLFRPNGRGRLGSHLLSNEAVEVLVELQATVVLWHSVPKDRKAAVPTPSAWVEQAKSDALERDWTLMVLHDRPSGHETSPMTFLSDFLKWTCDEGIVVEQDFPEDCLPMIAGVQREGLRKYVTPIFKPVEAS